MQKIPSDFIALLRRIVVAQDMGVAVHEQFQEAKISYSTIDRIMVEADIERLRMHHEGIDVYVPDRSHPDKSFILGLGDKPHKPST